MTYFLNVPAGPLPSIVRVPSEPMTECPRCEGTGEIITAIDSFHVIGFADQCPQCSSVCVVPVTFPADVALVQEVKCPVCKGIELDESATQWPVCFEDGCTGRRFAVTAKARADYAWGASATGSATGTVGNYRVTDVRHVIMLTDVTPLPTPRLLDEAVADWEAV